MAELRYNPLLDTWTMVAANRQARPQMPKDWCPFCPGSGRVPDQYRVHKYDNDFPALSPDPDETSPLTTEGPYQVAPAAGKCEVILYTPEHEGALSALPIDHVTEVITLWQERCIELERDERVRFVFPFENRGPEVGVTMPHPHGQVYAYPFVPAKLVTELTQSKAYFDRMGGQVLLDDMLAQERADGRRILLEDAHFVSVLPHFTDYPYGVFILAAAGQAHLSHLDQAGRSSLATHIKAITGAFDLLFDRPFPYMMCLHQTPVHEPDFEEAWEYYRLHIEFYPPLRDAGRIKYYASSEMGAGAAANTRLVEETAAELRNALERFYQQDPEGPTLALLRPVPTTTSSLP